MLRAISARDHCVFDATVSKLLLDVDNVLGFVEEHTCVPVSESVECDFVYPRVSQSVC